MAGWQSIRTEVLQRISRKDWPVGELIPGEVALAKEFGCARATVNRALRQLADEGLLDRRRKGGTRVALHPVRKAKLDIPITRLEVEQRGGIYSHQLLVRKQKQAPKYIQKIIGETKAKSLYLTTLHKFDDKPFLHETRWVNVDVVPEILDIDFVKVSVNEWLVENALFTRGEIVFSAKKASDAEAKILCTETKAALFIINRTTWNGQKVVTTVQLAYAPKFEMRTNI